MAVGREWPPEWRRYKDPISGVEITQLTNYRAHSYHLYFTNPGWYDGGRRLLFGSDRENRTNLFSVELSSGRIMQLTDLEPLESPFELSFLTTAVNPCRDEAYFWYGRQMLALDLQTLQMRVLWEMPAGFRPSMLNCTADGLFVCAAINEDLSDRLRIDYHRGYVGFRETWQANPLCRIVRVALDGGTAEVVWEERSWIGHVNTSPTRPELLTFCHEGPWELVDNRIWCLDLSSGRAWKVRPREGREAVGHEYWLQDGERIGYHGRLPSGERILGCIRYDNTQRVEGTVLHDTGHTHSLDFSLIVGDGGRELRLWRQEGGRFFGPRVLAEHRSSFHIQEVHVHPRFSPDGSYIVYTSDALGYGNVYIAPVAEFEALPPLSELAN